MRLRMITALLILSCLVSTNVSAAGYLKFDGIEGESTDAEHKDWINLVSYKWGMTRPSSGASGQSRRRGAAVVEDLTFVHELDTSSLRLADALASGRVISEVELHLHDGEQSERSDGAYLRYLLTNVSVREYHISWESDDRPTETVSINFEELEMEYVPAEGKPVEWFYDVEGGR